MALIQSGMRLTPAVLNSPTAYKTSDTTRTSTTTLAADPHLTVSVVANAVYVVHAYVSHTYDAACDMKVGWTGPTGATMTNWTARWRTIDGTETSGSFASISTTQALQSASGSLNQGYWAHGLLVVGSTAGSFAFAWAQNTSHANAATVRSGSILRLERIA